MEIGIVRKIDELGRIVIPVEMRNALGLDAETQISITMQDDRLILQAYRDSCFLCGNEVNILPIQGKFVCQKCVDELTTRNR